MSRFKILVFLLAVGIAGSILAASYWYYTRVMGRDSVVQGQIQKMQGKKSNLPDPGLRRFDEAIDLIKSANLEEGRKSLYRLLVSFPETSKGPEARRIIGEMNMDMLFSAESNPQRKDYIVQTGESLGLIARKNQTNIECIMRANGMLNPKLQPGDHLALFPLDFEIVVDVSAKTLQLWRGTLEKGYFFKEYQALDVKLPVGMKAPSETMVKAKNAWVGGKAVGSDNPMYVTAEKWLVCQVGQRAIFNIRALPKAKPLEEKVATAPSPSSKGKSKPGAKGDVKPVANDDDPLTGLPETGVFLAREDIEELFTIIRTQTKLFVAR